MTLDRAKPRQTLFQSAAAEGGKNIIDNEDDADDDDVAIKPYRNRSLAWTKRYRALLPYERARARVISFGHRSKSDWDDAVQAGSWVNTFQAIRMKCMRQSGQTGMNGWA